MYLFKGVMFIAFISIFALLPFFHPGFFTFHDDTQVARVYEMGKALQDGMFPVRWVQDLGYGYGYPLFNFYSPLPYYIAGIFILLGVNALIATKVTFVLGILMAAFSMFFLGRRIFNYKAAVVASVIYLYFPYHAVNIFVRGDLDELFAYAFLPLVFLGLFSLKERAEQSRKIDIFSLLLTGSSIALVILSHNLTFYMLGIFILLFTIIAICIVPYKKVFLKSVLGSLVLAFLLSAFYAIPAVMEMKYTNVFSQVGGGAHYPDHFVCISQLWDSMWGFGGSTKDCIDGLSFKLGKSNIVIAVMAIGLFIFSLFSKKRSKKDYIVGISLGFFVFSLFMTLSLSEFVWQILPMSSFLQYPWRFLNFVGLFISLLAGAAIYFVGITWSKKIEIPLLIIIILVTLFYNAKLFVPQTYLSKNSDDYTNKLYLTTKVSKISDEYLSSNFKKRNPPKSPIDIKSGKGILSFQLNKTGNIRALAQLQTNSILIINVAPFPAQKVFVDKKEVEGNPYTLSVPAGNHIIEVKYVQTAIEKIANLLTLIGVIALIFGIITIRKKSYEHKKTS